MLKTKYKLSIRAISLLSLFILVSPALADDHKPELTVYTYDSFAADWGPGPQIKSGFEQTCNCVLTFVGLDSSLGILGRIRLEGSNSKADVILGLDTSQSDIARQTGLLAPHGLTDLSKRLDLPDAAGTWDDQHFVPFDWGFFAFIYDDTKLSDVPASMADLISADQDLRIVIQDPRTSTPGFGLMLWLKTLYGDQAAAQWEALSPKIVTVTKGWSEAYGLFLDGEADMVLSYTTSPAYHRVAESQTQYQYANYSEGHYMQIEVAAMLASTDQPELAQSFLDFLLSDATQDIIPTTNWMYPAAKQVALPEGFEINNKPSGLLLADDTVARNQENWLKEWVMALSQ